MIIILKRHVREKRNRDTLHINSIFNRAQSNLRRPSSVPSTFYDVAKSDFFCRGPKNSAISTRSNEEEDSRAEKKRGQIREAKSEVRCRFAIGNKCERGGEWVSLKRDS